MFDEGLDIIVWAVIAVAIVVFAVMVGMFLLPIGAGVVAYAIWWWKWGRARRIAGAHKDDSNETRALYDEVERLQRANVMQSDQMNAANAIIREIEDSNGGELPDGAGEEIGVLAYILWHDAGFGEMKAFDEVRPEDAGDNVVMRNSLRIRQNILRRMSRNKALFKDTLSASLGALWGALPVLPPPTDGEAGVVLSVPVGDLLKDTGRTVHEIISPFFAAELGDLFCDLRMQLTNNMYSASNIPFDKRDKKEPKRAYEHGGSTDEIVNGYLYDTPFIDVLREQVPFSIPSDVRMEHTFICAGSGHGKTQTLQAFILRDLAEVREGKASLVVMDSQGDLLRTISHLAMFTPTPENALADRFILIDPNDISHPPALNMFAVDKERMNSYGAVEREKLFNGTVELYAYIFGALLGAELTQKQGVIFIYLARLMLVIPDANLKTLIKVMENGEAFRPHMDKLEGSAREFFETQFFHKSFDDTKTQISRRLWGVVSNSVFEKMFSSATNKVDLFSAMNEGSVILINTAKDLLKQQGCEIFGRFFIAKIVQAALERAAIPEAQRKNTYIYVDEASDYNFDENTEHLLNQGRKYRCGMTIATQFVDQLSPKMRGAVMASTSTKLAGGVNAKDARLLSGEMRCDAAYVQSMEKDKKGTEFACYVRNVTKRAVRLRVPFGVMEREPSMTKLQYAELMVLNSARISEGVGKGGEYHDQNLHQSEPAEQFELGAHRVL